MSKQPLSFGGDPLKDSFPNFLFVTWQYLRLPPPTPIQYRMAEYVQGGPKRRIVQGFRGVAKSWVSASYVCWRLYREPQLNIEIVSASKNLADNFSTFVLQLINGMEILHHLKPGTDQREAKVQFDVGPARASKDPSVKSVGITGQITGSRADLLIGDDIEVPSNSQTQPMRDKLAELVKEFDAVLKPGGEILLLGTPQLEQSLYNKLPQRGYDIMVFPARYPEVSKIDMYSGRLDPFIVTSVEADPTLAGKSTDPLRFSDIDLMERELSYGRSGFALQFLLDTSLSDANRYPLKLSDLIVMPLDPDRAPEKVSWSSAPELAISDLHNVGFNGDRFYRPMWTSDTHVEYTKTVMAIDPSGTGGDEVGYAVIKLLSGMLFVVAAGGLPGGYREETLKALSVIAKENKVNLVVVEPNMGDGMFSQLLKPVMAKIYPCVIEDTERSSSQKEARMIDVLEPLMNRHRLIFDRKVIERDHQSISHLPYEQGQKYSLMYQMTRLTRDRRSLAKDDRVDALALCVHYLVQYLARDVDDDIKGREEDARDKSIRMFLEELDVGMPSEVYSAVQW